LIYLLDVNVLVALIDPLHIHHGTAHKWFEREGAAGWATCPITQNGVLRIVASPSYTNSPRTPAAVAEVLADLATVPEHEFWADDLTLLSSPIVDVSQVLASKQVTDTYLLALARSHHGRLATFDRRLSTSAVRDGEATRLIVTD
jgi:toxin-antitoxin system PIN domain toxin